MFKYLPLNLYKPLKLNINSSLLDKYEIKYTGSISQ